MWTLTVLHFYAESVCQLFGELRPDILQYRPNLNLDHPTIRGSDDDVNGPIAVVRGMPQVLDAGFVELAQQPLDSVVLAIEVFHYDPAPGDVLYLRQTDRLSHQLRGRRIERLPTRDGSEPRQR